jgi:hypothetical protein
VFEFGITPARERISHQTRIFSKLNSNFFYIYYNQMGNQATKQVSTEASTHIHSLATGLTLPPIKDIIDDEIPHNARVELEQILEYVAPEVVDEPLPPQSRTRSGNIITARIRSGRLGSGRIRSGQMIQAVKPKGKFIFPLNSHLFYTYLGDYTLRSERDFAGETKQTDRRESERRGIGDGFIHPEYKEYLKEVYRTVGGVPIVSIDTIEAETLDLLCTHGYGIHNGFIIMKFTQLVEYGERTMGDMWLLEVANKSNMDDSELRLMTFIIKNIAEYEKQ